MPLRVEQRGASSGHYRATRFGAGVSAAPGDERRSPAPLPGHPATRHPEPAGPGAARRRLSEGGPRARGYPGAGLRARSGAAQPGRTPAGQRVEAAPADHGPHRRGHHRPREVDTPTVLGHAGRRLHLRARGARRQAERRGRPDDDAAPGAREGAADPRRDLPRRGQRGGQRAVWHQPHGGHRLGRDRRRVLPGRGWQRGEGGRRRARGMPP